LLVIWLVIPLEVAEFFEANLSSIPRVKVLEHPSHLILAQFDFEVSLYAQRELIQRERAVVIDVECAESLDQRRKSLIHLDFQHGKHIINRHRLQRLLLRLNQRGLKVLGVPCWVLFMINCVLFRIEGFICLLR
jgi:hypothetical protein